MRDRWAIKTVELKHGWEKDCWHLVRKESRAVKSWLELGEKEDSYFVVSSECTQAIRMLMIETEVELRVTR